MRRNDKSERLKTLSCRREPKMKWDGSIQLTKLGVVRVKTEMPEGRLVSFQLKDVTKNSPAAPRMATGSSCSWCR